MGTPIKHGQYPSRTAAVVAMRNAGMLPREIAKELGVNVAVVYTLSVGCDTEVVDRRKRRRMMRIPISDDVFMSLTNHAARRGLLAHELAAALVKHIVADDLVAAVLDDDKVIV